MSRHNKLANAPTRPPICSACGGRVAHPRHTQVRHIKTGERRAMLLCAGCYRSPLATWKLAWIEIEVDEVADR